MKDDELEKLTAKVLRIAAAWQGKPEVDELVDKLIVSLDIYLTDKK